MNLVDSGATSEVRNTINSFKLDKATEHDHHQVDHGG
jgi:hypothetical protein